MSPKPDSLLDPGYNKTQTQAPSSNPVDRVNGTSEMDMGCMVSTPQNTEISISVSLLEKVSPGKDRLGQMSLLILVSKLKGNPGLPYEKTMSQFQLKHIVKVPGE